jgi:hypothetical protein
MAAPLDQRHALMTAALGFHRLDLQDPAARVQAGWLDSWKGLGAITDGMLRQGFATDLTGGRDGWSASFLRTRAIAQEPVEPAGVSQNRL